MQSYYENEVEECVCCGEPTLARVVGVGAECEDCQAADNEAECEQ